MPTLPSSISTGSHSAQQILDLEALSLLPEPGGKAPALVPSPTDERSHGPGPETTWNEWYVDAVADDGSLGVYVRIGRVPNQDVALYTAAIVAPGQPSIIVFDAHAPLPPAIRIGEQEISLDGPGQRDHSWGPRDWWANDWMWNGLHLDDGTHIHVVTIPELEGFGVGYVQRDGVVDEISGATSGETVGDNGLIETATVTITHAVEQCWRAAIDGFAVLVAERITRDQAVQLIPATVDAMTTATWIVWGTERTIAMHVSGHLGDTSSDAGLATGIAAATWAAMQRS